MKKDLLSVLFGIGCALSCMGAGYNQLDTTTANPDSSVTNMALPAGGPRVGQRSLGNSDRPKPDAALQALIDEVVPKFKQDVWVNSRGDSLAYNIFVPTEPMKEGEEYPLVLFMADASTPGPDITLPLTQGYGGLVWATDEFQKEHPCFVVVPQYPYIEVDNQWQTGKQVDMTIELLRDLCRVYRVDTDRLYTTGQSMGGMMSMYFNVKYKGFFAASLYVACQWDISKMRDFSKDSFVYIAAEGDPGGHGGQLALMNLFNEEKAAYGSAVWSARLPESEQDRMAAALLAEGYCCNFITFEGNTVLPAGTDTANLPPASDHRASFDYAYRLAPVRDWLFRQSR